MSKKLHPAASCHKKLPLAGSLPGQLPLLSWPDTRLVFNVLGGFSDAPVKLLPSINTCLCLGIYLQTSSENASFTVGTRVTRLPKVMPLGIKDPALQNGWTPTNITEMNGSCTFESQAI